LTVDNTSLAIQIAVVQTRLDNLSERFEERDERLQDALDKIAAALPPLAARVEAIEKLKTQILAVAGASATGAGALAWLVEKVWP
jgi:predicted  nucleic acid-binding Zn-ribbon protein